MRVQRGIRGAWILLAGAFAALCSGALGEPAADSPLFAQSLDLAQRSIAGEPPPADPRKATTGSGVTPQVSLFDSCIPSLYCTCWPSTQYCGCTFYPGCPTYGTECEISPPDHLDYPERSETGEYEVRWGAPKADSYTLSRRATSGSNEWEDVFEGLQTSYSESVGAGRYKYKVWVFVGNRAASLEGSHEVVVEPAPGPPGPAFWRPYRVPGDFGSIQAAIEAATNGDTIIVERGTYNESINFRGKSIVLRSVDPRNPDVVSSTTLVAVEGRPVVKFMGTEPTTCVLSGFTIMSGDTFESGAGIRGWGTHGRIEYNRIEKNRSEWNGAGILDCDGVIRHNEVSNNEASHDGGGLYGCDGLIQGNLIEANDAADGGGLAECNADIISNRILRNFGHSPCLYGGTGYFRFNWVEGNRDPGTATVIVDSFSGPILDNAFLRNGYAGLAYVMILESCSGLIEGNWFQENITNGGTIHSCHTGAIRNNVFWNEIGNERDALISYSSVPIENNAIVSTSPSATSSMALVLLDSTGPFRNNIIRGYWSKFFRSSLPEYCCMEGWTGGGTGNFDLDPMFQKPEIGEFHLQTGSPCIDAGVTIPDITRDNEGKPRPCSGITGDCGSGYPFDIGAFEYTPPKLVDILLWRRWFSESEGHSLDYNLDGALDIADVVRDLSNPPASDAAIDSVGGKPYR